MNYKILHGSIFIILFSTSSLIYLPAITLVKGNIVHQKVDAIVNAANPELAYGGGVCGAIFAAAGDIQLQAACDTYQKDVQGKRCPVGEARITESFNLKGKCDYIIHAVDPDAHAIKDIHEQRRLLKSAYTGGLKLATGKNLKYSLSFYK